jgi:hypothetical protein
LVFAKFGKDVSYLSQKPLGDIFTSLGLDTDKTAPVSTPGAKTWPAESQDDEYVGPERDGLYMNLVETCSG